MLKKSRRQELIIEAAESLKSPKDLRSRIMKGLDRFRKTTGENPSKIHLTTEQFVDILQQATTNSDYSNIQKMTVFGIPIARSNRFRIS